MPLFQYRALTAQGKKIQGVIDADSYGVAKEKLLKQQILVTHLSERGNSGKELSLPSSLLLAFTRELGQLLNAGLPLYDSLATIEEKYRHQKTHALFLDLCDRLKGGSSLSAALKRYPKTFDEIYLSMVQAAEQTGSLPQVFSQLSLLISRQQKLKKQLASALAYPAFLGVFCILVTCGLLFFVIPSMQELFEGRQLHPLTHFILSLSQWMRKSGHLLLIALTFITICVMYLSKRKEGRMAIQAVLLKIPFCKTLLIQSALIRFCRAISMLLSGGVPLIRALTLARKVMRQPLLEDVIEAAEKKILEGKHLSDELKISPLVPRLVIRMLAIAEETGKMSEMLHSVAEIYDDELEKSLAQMTTFLQPALLLFLGVIVGVVVLSILLPLTDVSSFLSN